MKKRVVVVCPGRGTYTKETMGQLETSSLLEYCDQRRSELGFPTLSEMDQASSFQNSLHTKGEHASPLIYASSVQDFKKLKNFEIVAITGNSMGWYTALALAGAVSFENGFEVIQTMGAMMKEKLLGSQVITQICNDDWTPSPPLHAEALSALDIPNTFLSIKLGGYLVFGCESVSEVLKRLPRRDRFPFQLINHAAFHTPLMAPISQRAFETLNQDLFTPPKIPLIDGRGKIWQPFSTEAQDLYEYTFGHQVVEVYNYSKAIEVAVKEFAPDHLVMLGPGSSLGGATAQVLIEQRWKGIKSKEDFGERQIKDPFLLSFALQKELLTSS